MTYALPRRRNTNAQIFNRTHDDFSKGVVTILSEARLPVEAAKQAYNLIQSQDGLWETRWGTKTYGLVTPNGLSPDGSTQYVKNDETTELIVVANKVYKSTDGGTWTEILLSGGGSANFTVGNQCFFLQIESKLYITNGVNVLAFYDGTDISTYTEINAPAWDGTPLTRGAGLTTGNYTYYYQITALNDIGETVGSTEQSIAVNLERDTWTTPATQYIDLGFAAVSGATRYQIYFSDETGFEVLIGSTTTDTFRDDGTLTPNPYIEVPDDNTTGGPIFGKLVLSGNRIWGIDSINKYRTHFSGTGQYLSYFSPFYGGGWIELEKGGENMPKVPVHYRTGRGDSVLTVLCSSPSGRGNVWQISLGSITVENTTFTVPSADKIIGALGTRAPLSVVEVGNSIVFHNDQGFTLLGSKPNLLNVLDASEISQSIRPNVRDSIVSSQSHKICGIFYEGKIFYSVPEGSTGNSKIYVYDTEKRNWNPDAFSIGIKQFIEYTDSSENTHLLGVPVTGTQLIEFSNNITGDEGSAFLTTYLSGLTPINGKDKTVWAKIKNAYVELYNPKGTITFTLLGTEKKRGYSTLGSVTISDLISNTGYSFDRYSTFRYSTSLGIPSTFSSSSRRKKLKVNKLLNNYQFKVSSTGKNDKYAILSFQVKGKIIPTQDPKSWN